MASWLLFIARGGLFPPVSSSFLASEGYEGVIRFNCRLSPDQLLAQSTFLHTILHNPTYSYVFSTYSDIFLHIRLYSYILIHIHTHFYMFVRIPTYFVVKNTNTLKKQQQHILVYKNITLQSTNKTHTHTHKQQTNTTTTATTTIPVFLCASSY